MKRLLALLFILSTRLGITQDRESLDVLVDPDITYQTIHSFGASDSWRVQFVGKYWPEEKRNQIADLLFSMEIDESGNPKGIGLSTWRFYLGAGTMEQGEASGIGNEWRRAECFQNPDGSYNWNKYEGQKWFVHAAKKRGVENFLLYSISPPVHMSRNGLGYATKGETKFNIETSRYGDYANYMVDVIEYFKNKEHIHFQYLSPFNEPQWKWDEANQEGSPANNSELFEFLQVLSTSLGDRQLTTQIVPGEAGSINYLFASGTHPRGNQIQVFFDPSSEMYLGDLPNMKKAISGHSYFSTWPIEKQIQSRQKLRKRLLEVNPELEYWQTEFCILEKSDELGSGGGRDLGMPLALYVTRVIHSDLAIANSNTWEWWTALSQVDYKDGLIHLDPIDTTLERQAGREAVKYDGSIVETKLLWAMGNFSRFVRPGMQRIEVKVDNVLSLAEQAKYLQAIGFKDADSEKIVLVFINHRAEKKEINLTGIKPSNVASCRLYVTDQTRDLEMSAANVKDLTIPPRAVATLIVEAQ